MLEDSSGGRLLVIAALLIGLLSGGSVFVWWMRTRPAPVAIAHSTVQEQPAAPVEPPLAPVPQEPPVTRRSSHKSHMAKVAPPQPEPISTVAPEPDVQPPPPPVIHDQNKRKAVQETDTLTGPMSPSPEPAPQEQQGPSQQSAPAPAVTAVKYGGPLSGVATWTGKLKKGQVLTITGGTPSTGSLSGAGLPGVPVRITVDQTNLGFVVVPMASNGYKTVTLKSHAKHNRITIHWNVAQ